MQNYVITAYNLSLQRQRPAGLSERFTAIGPSGWMLPAAVTTGSGTSSRYTRFFHCGKGKEIV